MSVFKCKMCGATLNIPNDTNVFKCEYCDTEQTVPVINSQEKEDLYERANYFFHNNEYDKAIKIYEEISNLDPRDPESYFMQSLCKYGIEYVEDSKSKKRIPTLHRLHYEPISNNVNYKKAIKHADSTQKILYEKEAKYIDEVRNKILDISKKEKPYDVFICYKETDEKGQRTEDSVLAMDIYNELTKEGLKVFFSRVTLEGKLGVEYEPYIFAALNSAKVMVVVGTKPEYINSPWVRNEWTRFLDRVDGNKSNKKNSEKCFIVPAYKGMSPYALPNEFSSIQAQDMSKVGATQDLVHGIKKLLNKNEETKPTNGLKKFGKVGIIISIILIIAIVFVVIKIGINNERIAIGGVEYLVNKEYDTLTLQGKENLSKEETAKIKRIKSIRILYFKNSNLQDLNFLCELNNIKGIEFDSSTKVSDSSVDGVCNNIEYFKIDPHSLELWETLDMLKSMPNLRELYVPTYLDLSPISKHDKLEYLEMYTYGQYHLIDNFLWCEGLNNLKKIKMTSYKGTINFAGNDDLFKGIENLKCLEELIMIGTIEGGWSLRNVDFNYISELNNLKVLDIGLSGTGQDLLNEKYLIHLNCLHKMVKLEYLKLKTYNNFDLLGLNSLVNLKEVVLKGTIYNKDLSELANLKQLENLDLSISKPNFRYINNVLVDPVVFSLSGVETLNNLEVLAINTSGKGVTIIDEELVKNNNRVKYIKTNKGG